MPEDKPDIVFHEDRIELVGPIEADDIELDGVGNLGDILQSLNNRITELEDQ